jgi:uncharacterized membrane protein
MWTYLVMFMAVILVDIPYLWIRQDFHKAFFAIVQKSPLIVRYIPAVIVYLLFAYALTSVALNPAKSLADAAYRGSIVGAVMYGFYDATNMATLSGWTWEMASMDTLWGAAAGALATSAVYAVLKK